MKLTAITNQASNKDRYSLFIDSKYSFSLSTESLLESKLAVGDEITALALEKLKAASNEDKLYGRALSLVSSRSKSNWEVAMYLKRKGADEDQIKNILSKLSNLKLINDESYAQAFVNTKTNLKPISKRKLIAELKKKKISETFITSAIENIEINDVQSLKQLIERKRTQTKYKDQQKLMQYLSRQGFNYGDIKQALSSETEDYL
jgi:regulatory protein